MLPSKPHTVVLNGEKMLQGIMLEQSTKATTLSM